MDAAIKLLLMALLMGLFLAGVPSHCARAHEAPTGWSYDASCCSNEDCAPLPDGEVQERPDGYLLRSTGELIPLEKAKQSQDEHYHLCRSELTKNIYCIYIPNKGV